MLMNNMNVFQSNGLYYVFNEQGELKSMIYLPHDGQLLADFKTLISPSFIRLYVLFCPPILRVSFDGATGNNVFPK